jgi:hypothetical protein
MEEAGFGVFASWGITDDPLEADMLWIVKIYRAMCSASLQASDQCYPKK